MTRPDNRRQFSRRPVSYRWPRPATLRQIVEYNSLLFCQLEGVGVNPNDAAEMIVCAVQGVSW